MKKVRYGRAQNLSQTSHAPGKQWLNGLLPCHREHFLGLFNGALKFLHLAKQIVPLDLGAEPLMRYMLQETNLPHPKFFESFLVTGELCFQPFSSCIVLSIAHG